MIMRYQPIINITNDTIILCIWTDSPYNYIMNDCHHVIMSCYKNAKGK